MFGVFVVLPGICRKSEKIGKASRNIALLRNNRCLESEDEGAI